MSKRMYLKALSIFLIFPGASLAENFPNGIRYIIPSTAGGAADTVARQFVPYFETALGSAVGIEYHPGGGTTVAAGVLARNGDSCEAVFQITTPTLLLAMMALPVDISYDDFYPLAALYTEPGLIRVRNDAPWATLQDLIDDAKTRPGEITASVSEFASTNYVGLIQIERETGAEFNTIPFQGGGPARNALLRGEVDFTHAGVFGSLPIASETRVLAVHTGENRWPELTDDAPTVNEALNANLPDAGQDGGVLVTKACYEQHPELYGQLQAAFLEAQTNPEYVESLTRLGEEGKILLSTAGEFHQYNLDRLEEFNVLIEEHPELVSR